MRRDNRALDRYRIAADKLIELLVHHRPASITDINIQAGEDPVAVREIVLPLVRAIRATRRSASAFVSARSRLANTQNFVRRGLHFTSSSWRQATPITIAR